MLNDAKIYSMLKASSEAAKAYYYTKDCTTMQQVDWWVDEATIYSTFQEAVTELGKQCSRWKSLTLDCPIDKKILRQFFSDMQEYLIEPVLESPPLKGVEFFEWAKVNDLRHELYSMCNCVKTCVEQANKKVVAFPDELNTEQAKKYFAKAIEAGLMNEQYKWAKSKALLACFCREMSNKLNLSKATKDDGGKYVKWKPFEMLFGYRNLKLDLNQIKQTGENPKGIEIVDSIFKD